MQWYAEGRNKKPYLALLLLIFSVSLVLNVLVTHRAAALTLTDSGGSTVGVTVCAPESTVTLTKPVSDSVATDSQVQIEGTVSQAGQIEIRIDDVFDSIIPLDMGQTTFSGSVQVTSGTHTIKVTAVNVCPGPNGTASSVVTYSPPPQNPSTGSEVPTDVEGGVIAPGDLQKVNDSSTNKPGLIDRTLLALQDVARWLNIGIKDTPGRNLSAMSVGQAVALTTGMLLAVIGVAPPLLRHVADIPAIAAAAPGVTVSGRMRFLSIGGRIIGVGFILGSLFL